jgi:hypothetical protein
MYRVRYYVDVDWVGEGTGGVGQAPLEANNPAAGPVGMAQTMRMQGAQYVTGGGYGTAPTTSNFLTAFTGMGVDINNQFTANSNALYTIASNWEAGSP